MPDNENNCCGPDKGWPWPVPVDSITLTGVDRIDTLANLNAALKNISAAISAATLKPRPRYVLDGQEFDWTSYMKMLTDAMEAIMKMRQMFGVVKAGWLGKKRCRIGGF